MILHLFYVYYYSDNVRSYFKRLENHLVLILILPLTVFIPTWTLSTNGETLMAFNLKAIKQEISYREIWLRWGFSPLINIHKWHLANFDSGHNCRSLYLVWETTDLNRKDSGGHRCQKKGKEVISPIKIKEREGKKWGLIKNITTFPP